MKRRRILPCCFCGVALVFLLAGCAVPRLLYPQQDIAASQTAIVNKRQAVLIASRSSEYKKALVAELHRQLAGAGIPQRTIGVDALREVDSRGFGAVVVINTCLAWGLDHDIESFLKQQESHANIILMTTSGDGAWLPDRRGRDYDAISGASTLTNVEAVARDVMVRIRKRLHR